jgi:hypothetical protein
LSRLAHQLEQFITKSGLPLAGPDSLRPHLTVAVGQAFSQELLGRLTVYLQQRPEGIRSHQRFPIEVTVSCKNGVTRCFDLPPAEHASELDLYFAADHADAFYEALVTISALPGVGPPSTLETKVVKGSTGSYHTPKKADIDRFERYGQHVRLVLPSRALRGLRISIAKHELSGSRIRFLEAWHSVTG